MAHHSSEQDSEKIGPTREFPEGKLTEQDEGELKCAVFTTDGKVVIDFNSPVHWVGMTKEQAQELAGLLIKYANKI